MWYIKLCKPYGIKHGKNKIGNDPQAKDLIIHRITYQNKFGSL